ncbi:RidA family protein [Sphingorhabdus sp. 109]|jgi:reactive intermediate/imine deaminase|uniref:RidA family protein n=1 Tax=Sphingorhabdus sp. 109 TaxID=2653173 RepID=UPI0012F3F8ED|nr:RidA family protein [Sphingorhabdus sp. 109]VWX57769.1 2-iminobutanoate/2-iminopropanoate deaminase [Sphingorhabdus sp. 109]
MSVKTQVINLDPDPLAPYAISPAWRVGDLLLLSGQAAIDEQGQVVGIADFDAQLRQVFINIDRILQAAGSSRDKIIKVTIYLTDMENFAKIVQARKIYFNAPYPADTTLEVKALALPDLMVEIDVIATA